MKKTRSKWLVPFVGVLLVLAACTSQQGAKDRQQGIRNTQHPMNVSTHNDQDVNVIPSTDRSKKLTTNQHGEITSGPGSNVYSLIGSSSLHDGGISSHLESRLAGEGIPGIKVFVLDDTVILARAKQENTSIHYDDMQNRVLSGTNGSSGKVENNSRNDIDNNVDDNLDHAKRIMNDAFDGHVQILTITNANAPKLIERIKSNLKGKAPSYNQLTNDINTLVQMTKEKS
ncbi:hypothetical protein B5V89_00160 [Heyndrickxia sporothermodurans]|uniref:Uncharacterized protein n=1 Tax=Heyndrickxia vini TaxID=1476025 RepID=A0ABX7E422_9BACI|nr:MULTISPECIES: hypothetical protein [Heyndrickxia]PTY80740.1 hypothetical protein B5V89_00160 [Heyndrickxia sporothermodurans]QQZ10463.1 hypothetical protein I5776_05900 [Heyndrickxia vini]